MFKVCGRRWDGKVKVHRYEELSVGGEEWVKNVHGMHIESE